MSQDKPSSLRGWTVVGAALAINLVLGSLYAWSVMGRALHEQWHWSATDASWPFSVATAAFAITMIFAGRLQDKIGPRFVAMAGGVMLGLGLFTSSLTHTPTTMWLTFGVIGGMGIGLGYSSTTPPSIKWFAPSRKGLITGLVVSGIGLSAIYISPLTQYLLRVTDIARTFQILGVGTVVIVALLALVLANPPAGYTPAPGAGAASSRARAALGRRDVNWPQMLRSRQFYQLWLMLVLSAFAGLMIIAHAARIAKFQAGMEWGWWPVATLALFNTLGRLAGGALSDRFGRTRTLILAFLLQAVNMFAFVHYTTPGLIMFGAAFTGVCYGTLFPLMPSATADFFGVRNLGVNYGCLFTAFGVAGVLGPIVGGRMFDLHHSYSYSYTISAVLLLLAAGVALTVRPPKSEAGDVPAPAQSIRPALTSPAPAGHSSGRLESL
jgi:OFA family oxalate/formate antiporter-like MFS transporter